MIVALFLLEAVWMALYLWEMIKDSTLLAILLVVTFILISIITQSLMHRHFEKRTKNKRYHSKYYRLTQFSDLEQAMIKVKATRTVHPFGQSYLLIEGEIAYKVTVIEQAERYFELAKNSPAKLPTNKKLEACKKFISYEFFRACTPEVIDKTAMFSFQGERFYFSAFYYKQEEKSLVQTVYEKPSIENEPYVSRLQEILLLEEYPKA